LSTLTKVLVVLVTVMSIALSVLFVSTASRWEHGARLAENLLQQRDAAIAERTKSEAMFTLALAQKDSEVQTADAARAEAVRRAEQLGLELRALRAQLAQEENRAASAEAGRKKLEEIVHVQTAQLTSFEKQNQTLLSENIDLQTRNQQLASRNYELTSELTIRDDELRNLKERIAGREGGFTADITPGLPPDDRFAIRDGADYPVNTGPLATATPVANIRGEVVEVAGNYASVNVGESSGLTKGMVAMVFRGQQYLADLQIETVRPREAGGKLTTRVGEVRSGDRIQIIRR
jgi:hypothetical protein